MADHSLPIVLAGRPRDKLIVLALGLVLLVGGMFMILDRDGGLLRGGARPSDVGWLVSAVGGIFAVLALLALARVCPRLELHRDGILYRRCLRGVTRIAWSEFDRAEVLPVRRPRTIGGDIILDCVKLVTTDGRQVVVSAPIAPEQAQDVQELITAVATRILSGQEME